MHIGKLIRVSLTTILSFGIVGEVYALGGANIGNEVPSARAAGQGYVAVAGQNNDPTTVYSNPAAITNLKGMHVAVGAIWENIQGSYESDAGAETKARPINALVPNASITQSFLDGKLGAGLSIQSPFGLETQWPGNSPMRYVATNSRLRMTMITPAVAYQIHPMISVGAGVDYVNLFSAQLDRNLNVDAVNTALGVPSAGSPDAVSSLRGQASDWGYHTGLLVEPSDKHAFGVTYHSKVNLRVNGNVTLSGLTGASAFVFGGSNYSSSAYTDFVLPENIQFGYAFKPTEKWLLEMDTAWFHWSDSRDLRIRYSETDPTRLAALNTGNPATFDLRDVWSFAAGVNYKANEKWQLRGGLWYVPWALPEVNFNPAFLDLSRYGISTGVGYALTENLTLDAAYNVVFLHNRTVHNDVGFSTTGIPAPTADIDGTYKNFANTIAFNLTYRYGGNH